MSPSHQRDIAQDGWGGRHKPSFCHDRTGQPNSETQLHGTADPTPGDRNYDRRRYDREFLVGSFWWVWDCASPDRCTFGDAAAFMPVDLGKGPELPLLEQIRVRADEDPRAVALDDGIRRLTRGELLGEVAALAAVITARVPADAPITGSRRGTAGS